jgi:glycosyltransferase involved in cell wall biosynthesis
MLAALAAAQPDSTSLFLPNDDVAGPELSIVIPALNEELTISEFVSWCRQGLQKAGVCGEILIVDSSTDSTPQKALSAGARVLRTPRRGLGRAYMDAIPFIRGEFVLLGDADLTYDFREIAAFLEKFRQGYQYIMGSRFQGHIEDGAMPPLHRYFGTPLTTWILNRLYATNFSDIHCGMRGITRQALFEMDIQSNGWEYASEMVLKSVQMGLRSAEVPVVFHKDREGRTSHHKRSGWLSPWVAGWTNLRTMLVGGSEFFALRPGLVVFFLGLFLTLPLSLGPLRFGSYTFSLYWMLLGMALTVAGLQSFYLGCLSQILHDYRGQARSRWLRVFSYNRTILGSSALILVGAASVFPLVREYIHYGFTLDRVIDFRNHLAILGLLLLICGFVNFIFTLVLHAAAEHAPETRRF